MSNITNYGADLDNISPTARGMLEGMTKVAGIPELRARSGYRSPKRNAKAGGAKKSQHIHGNAIDLDVSGYSDDQKAAILDAAIANGAKGVGIYPSGNSIHIDTREKPGVWGWNPAGAYEGADENLAPAWARDKLKMMMGGGVAAPVESQPLPPVGDQSPTANRKMPSWWTTVEQNAASAGVESDTLYRIGGAESMFRNIDAKGSTATGPFQIIEGTWKGLQKNYPALNLGDRRDPNEQAKAAPYLLREYTDDVQRRVGRKISVGEQYLAWFLGPRDAAKVLNSNEGADPQGIITPASIASNPAVFGKIKTVAELRAWADKKMAGNGLDDAPPPMPSDAPFSDRITDATAALQGQEPATPFTPRERTAMEKALAGDAYSLGEGFYRALGQETTGQIASWLQPGPASDPSFNVTQELLKDRAADIPTQFLDYLSGSGSAADFDARAARIRSDLEVQRKLGAMGGTGVALQLGAAIVDPAGWVATLAAAPIGGAAKAGKASRILFGAAEGLAANLAIEGVTAAVSPTWEVDRLAYAAAGGLIFGSVFGAIGRTSPDIAEEVAGLQKASKGIMDDVEQRFDHLSSAGAAQNPVTRDPVRTDISDFMTRNFDTTYGKATFGKARIDLAGMLKNSENPLVRALGHTLVEDGVGNKDFSATLRAVSEDQAKLMRQNQTWWLRDMNSNWTDYAKRNGHNSYFGGDAFTEFKRQTMMAARNTDPMASFDPAVLRQADTFKKIMERYLKIAKGDRREFDGTTRPGLPGFRDTEPKPDYVPRLVHWDNFRLLQTEVGTSGLKKLVKGAIRGMNADLPDSVVERIGEGYVKRLSSVEAGQELTAARVFSNDNIDEIRMNLEATDLTPDEIDMVLRPLERDAGNGAGTPRGKRRQLLHEGFSIELPTKNGTTRKVSVAELFDGDIDRVFQSYNRNMSGQIALGGLRVKNPNFRPDEDAPEHLIDGIQNRGEWDKLMAQVRAVASSEDVNPLARETVDTDINRLQFAYDQIAGIGTAFDASKTARYLRLGRDYIFTRVMGQVGFAQIAEAGMITSAVGLKTAIKSMPSLRKIIKDARAGRLAEEDARHLEWISTGGTDWIRGSSHVREDGSGIPLNAGSETGALAKAEGLMSRGVRLQSAASGMAPINTYLQRWASKAALYKFLDMSAEGARVNRKRMRVLGLDDDMQDRIFAEIRKNSGEMTGETEGTVLRRLNLETWEPDTRAAFEHAIFRWTRRMIQENDIGQTNLILGSTVGKIVFQFRQFMFGAWTKNTLHNLHMRDWQSMASIITTMTFGGLAYTAQSHLASLARPDREEFLQDRLNPTRLAAASFQRAGFSSMFPMLLDNMGKLAGFDPLFDTRVTGTPSQGFTSFPLVNALDDAYKAVQGISGVAHGDQYDDKDWRKLSSLAPFQNTLPMLWFFNSIGRALPQRD